MIAAFVLLLPASLAAVVTCALREPRIAHLPRADRVVTATALWGGLLVAVTYLLSAARLLTPAALAAFWGGVTALCLMRALTRGAPLGTDLCLRLSLPAVPIICLLAVESVTGLFSPPNNWDSMTYHMARVGQWGQNASVAFFPTSVPRQNWLPAGGEFLLLHVNLLSGSDRLVNLVQLAAHAGCIFLAFQIAALFGAAATGRWVAAYAAATVPMAVLQASSTQNDLVVSFWTLSVVYLARRLTERPSYELAGAAGIALGLVVLTKPSAAIAAAPCLVGLLLPSAARFDRRQKFTELLLVAGISIAVNLPFFLSNARVYRSPLGPAAASALRATHFSPGAVPGAFSGTSRRTSGPPSLP